jgi:hypothetical protein
MSLAENKSLLSRTWILGLIVVPIVFALGSGAAASNAGDKFAGTWHWMFHGESFATMVLVRSGAGFTGSVTGSRIRLNDDGSLLQADADEDATPKPITKGVLEGSTLHVTVKDGFEFDVTADDNGHAEIRPKGAPANMKPIVAEKAR